MSNQHPSISGYSIRYGKFSLFLAAQVIGLVAIIQPENFVLCNEVKGYGAQRVNRFYLHDAWLDR